MSLPSIMEKLNPIEYLPGAHLQSDEELTKAAGDISLSIFHPVGTCKMGVHTDQYSVVDNKLKIHGIDDIRIADGSIMPTITSGNTNSPIMMIAEKAASFILNEKINT